MNDRNKQNPPPSRKREAPLPNKKRDPGTNSGGPRRPNQKQ